MRGEEMEKTRAQIIGARLRDLRKEAGLTQQEVADAIGVAKSQISMYERGERSPGDASKVGLARLFGIDIQSTFYDGLDWGGANKRNTNLALIHRAEESGRSLQDIADALGLSRFIFWTKLQGRAEFTQQEIKNLCEVLHITSPQEIVELFFM